MSATAAPYVRHVPPVDPDGVEYTSDQRAERDMGLPVAPVSARVRSPIVIARLALPDGTTSRFRVRWPNYTETFWSVAEARAFRDALCAMDLGDRPAAAPVPPCARADAQPDAPRPSQVAGRYHQGSGV